MRRCLAVVAAALLAGCAGTVDSEVVMIDYDYEPRSLTVPAATPGFELVLRNEGAVPHDFSVEGLPADILVHLAVLPGGEVAYPLPSMPPGEYVVYCGIDGHRERGMTATLTVR